MSKLLRDLQKLADVPRENWVSESKETSKCPFCDDIMDDGKLVTHIKDRHKSELVDDEHEEIEDIETVGKEAEEEAAEEEMEYEEVAKEVDMEEEEAAPEKVKCPLCHAKSKKMSKDEFFDHFMNKHAEQARMHMTHPEEDEEMTFKTNLKKGQKVYYKGIPHSVEVPNAKADFVGIVPVGKEGNKDEVDLVRVRNLSLESVEDAEENMFNEAAINKFFVVTDPMSKDSEMADILSEQTPQSYTQMVVGSTRAKDSAAMLKEHPAFYDNKEEATADAEARLKKAGALKEGEIQRTDIIARDLLKAKPKMQEAFYKKAHKAMMDGDLDKAEELINRVKNKKLDEEKAETNTNMLLDLPAEWMKDKAEDDKVKVPAKVKSELKTRLKEIKAEKEDIKGRDETVAKFYEDIEKIVNEILELLNEGTIESCKKAAVYLTSLKSPIQYRLPKSLWKWLATGTEPSLKDYFNTARADEK